MLLRTFNGRSQQVMTTSVNPDRISQREQLSDTAQINRVETVVVLLAAELAAANGV